MVMKMDCIFCKISKKEIPSSILFEDELVMAIMDANPNVDGHVLIIPKKHYTDYLECDEEITLHMFHVAKELGPKIMDKLKAKSLTLLMNYGDDQQVKHVHLHLLPNFGTSKGMATKDKEEVYHILKG